MIELKESKALTIMFDMCFQWYRKKNSAVKSAFDFSFKETLFCLCLFLSVTEINAQCDYISGNITIGAQSGSYNILNSQQYLLATPSGEILQTVTSDAFGNGIFQAVPSGFYRVYAINYPQNGLDNGVLDVGENINNISGSCFDLSSAYSIEVCDNMPNAALDVCDGDDIVVQSVPGSWQVGYEQTYILVDQNDLIVAFDRTGVFSNLPEGSYKAYAINYDPVENPSNAGLVIGAPWPLIPGFQCVDAVMPPGVDAIVNVCNACQLTSYITDDAGYTHEATRECTDNVGWTHYYDDMGTPTNENDDLLLLSILKNGQNFGTVGDGDFEAVVEINPGYNSNSAIDLSNAPYISNAARWFVMHRYWNVEPNPQITVPVRVRFYYTDRDFNDIQGSLSNLGGAISSHADLIFYKIDLGNPNPFHGHINVSNPHFTEYTLGTTSSLSNWVYGGHNGNHFAEFMVNSFSGGGGGARDNGGNPLPITLLYFKGQHESPVNFLEWETAMEIDNDFFIIERANDAVSFSEIGRVDGAGNSTSILHYSLIDRSPIMGINYYRLKQVDFNGQFSYSQIISIEVNPFELYSEIEIGPNPFGDFVKINLISERDEKVEFEVHNVLGQKVYSGNLKVSKGSNHFHLDMFYLAAGSYTLSLTKGIQRQNFNLIKYN